jgi:hypothetical protein
MMNLTGFGRKRSSPKQSAVRRFPGEFGKPLKLRITCVHAEIRTENLPNVNLERWWYTNLFGIPNAKAEIFTCRLVQ